MLDYIVVILISVIISFVISWIVCRVCRVWFFKSLKELVELEKNHLDEILHILDDFTDRL